MGSICFKKQIDHMEAYLREEIQSAEFFEFMEQVDIKCNMDFDGSDLYKWICIMRRAGDHLDKDGSVFMRLESDGPPSYSGPFILAVNVAKSFVFELYVEKVKLMGNLSITESIAAFLHLAFIVDLQYPKEAQTVCDIVQRRFAKYGDSSGTRTQTKKETASSRINKYDQVLGRIL